MQLNMNYYPWFLAMVKRIGQKFMLYTPSTGEAFAISLPLGNVCSHTSSVPIYCICRRGLHHFSLNVPRLNVHGLVFDTVF